MVPDDQVLSGARQLIEYPLKVTSILRPGAESKVPDDPEIIIVVNPLAHARDQNGIHLLHGGKGAITELHDVLMTEVRISSVPVSYGCYPSFPDLFVG
ncbi:hypothetical protein [Roseobacter sp.]|uniref:hypothetical protein n=1 Tax=Roseobacter sp. TaxID=1907202 RepID=UPI002966DEDC|nr:hypothetical protein [Roseobacter sp.]MDW3181366.1 hypothetical protein [Roseobacter sp.]